MMDSVKCSTVGFHSPNAWVAMRKFNEGGVNMKRRKVGAEEVLYSHSKYTWERSRRRGGSKKEHERQKEKEEIFAQKEKELEAIRNRCGESPEMCGPSLTWSLQTSRKPMEVKFTPRLSKQGQGNVTILLLALWCMLDATQIFLPNW